MSKVVSIDNFQDEDAIFLFQQGLVDVVLQEIHDFEIWSMNLGTQTVLFHFEGGVSQLFYEFNNDALKTLSQGIHANVNGYVHRLKSVLK